VSDELIWEPEAFAQAERLATDDPGGGRQVFSAVEHLADDPSPEGAFGSADMLRSHIPATTG
jgi:mRNA interferase RelE/StbE